MQIVICGTYRLPTRESSPSTQHLHLKGSNCLDGK
jgi:hypothetical protein